MRDYLSTSLYVLSPLLAGAILRRLPARFLPPLFHLLERIIIWILLPLIVLVSIARYSLPELLGGVAATWIAFLTVGVCFLFSTSLCFLAGLSRERTVGVVLNSSFMNVGHLGLPLVYALLGSRYLLPASFYAVAVAVLNLMVGTFFLSSLSGRRMSLLSYFMGFPPLLALLFAFLFVVFQAPLPQEVGSFFDDYLAGPSFFLMLFFAGYCLEAVEPKRYGRELLMIGITRFLISPAVTLLAMLAMDLSFSADLSPRPSLLLSLMPPAVFNLVLAHSYRKEVGLFGASVMCLTPLSLFLLFLLFL